MKLDIVSIILGVLAIAIGFTPLPYIGTISAIAGIVTGMMARKNLAAAGQSTGKAMIGIILSVIALLITIGFIIYVFVLIAEYM
jgi:hypothetical protein